MVLDEYLETRLVRAGLTEQMGVGDRTLPQVVPHPPSDPEILTVAPRVTLVHEPPSDLFREEHRKPVVLLGPVRRPWEVHRGVEPCT